MCHHTWTSVPITRIADSRFRSTIVPDTHSFEIPDIIPEEAKEVLLYAAFWSGNSNPTVYSHFKIYTEEGDQKYEKYISLWTFNNNFGNTNSDNLWFPLTSNRRVYLEATHTFNANSGGHIFVIGYC